MNISHYMKGEHRLCDDYFAKAEEAASKKDWEEATKQFEIFAHETLQHFKKEEEVLFPAFEKQTGSTEGPTAVMRYEHEQVKGLIGKMASAIIDEDMDACLSLAESMMILLQQHNMKEEQMLYAMCDNILPAAIKEETLETMKHTEL
ncbi:MAG TPA: hemerythrin HHE cation-binding protein [Sulfurovum sp. UBA12169]|nr:MAG TPA: hemerythrin HHE cation-binding protein [Sulfurovum sp. UBA12169]